MMPSTSRTRGSSGVQGSQRFPLAPMSERQQMALVMQLTQNNAPAPTPTPAEERKRTRQQRNERGETPLHVAAIRGDHEQVQKLLDQGEHPDVPDFAGWTPLHEACSYGWLQVVTVLVEGGANVNARGLDDDTPLHDAATSGNLKMVKYLVENGADPSLKNTKGKTPADYAAQHIYEYFVESSDSGIRVSSQVSRSRDDSSSSKKGGGGNASGEGAKSSMDVLASDIEGKEAIPSEKVTAECKDEGVVSSGVVSSSVDDIPSTSKRGFYEDPDTDDEEIVKKKKRKDEDKEPMGKPAPPPQRGNTGRLLQGTKQPGPASKTGGNAMKASSSSSSKGSGSSKGSQGKQGTLSKGKSSGGSKGSGSTSKDRQKSPVASPKPSKDDDEDMKPPEPLGPAPKVPPLKIVIPGGASGSGGRNEQEGEGQGKGKGRGGNVLPYVIPCTSNDGPASDSSDTNSDEKLGRSGDNKNHHDDHGSNVGSSKSESRSSSVDLHPRKRKIKTSRDHREQSKSSVEAIESVAHNVQHSNPYQMYIHIRKQIDQRQKSLFPVKPKPPKDFNKYLMNRCTYTLQSNVNHEPQIEMPHNLPPQMKEEFIAHEKERHRLRIQHLVEKEKLVLAVEQEILRVHGRAERAVANQSLPFSVCTMLRDKEVYNVIAPEQEEKRNAQRSRCNGRQINSWLQEVDDKWEKIKEGMLRRQHTEAQTLHAVQTMGWEWKLKEVGLCDYKTTPKIDALHVPQIHVSNFDLPA